MSVDGGVSGARAPFFRSARGRLLRRERRRDVESPSSCSSWAGSRRARVAAQSRGHLLVRGWVLVLSESAESLAGCARPRYAQGRPGGAWPAPGRREPPSAAHLRSLASLSNRFRMDPRSVPHGHRWRHGISGAGHALPWCLLIQRCQDAQERTAEPDAVVRRDPSGLSLEKSEGNSVRLVYENMRRCARIRILVGQFVEKSRIFARILTSYLIS